MINNEFLLQLYDMIVPLEDTTIIREESKK